MTHPARSLFCFGMGYSASRLAARAKEAGFQVAGTHRASPAEGAGQTPQAEMPGMHAFGPFQPFDDAWLEGISHLLISIPPDAQGDPVLRAASHSLARRAAQFAWVGYLSTTGVYGDHAGGMVDENTPLKPAPGRSTWRAEAEAQWLALFRQHRLPVHIFRLAGIYGPGRNVLENVLAGTAKRINKPGHVFSRIHVEDIATILQASIARPNPGAIYNVCDDEAAEGAAVTAYACELAGAPVPPLMTLEDAALSPMARSFYADSRRVSNQRIKHELGVRLAFPTYREGLAALWTGMRT